jgi:hypothetical protein
MPSTNFVVPESLSFEQAITLTQTLLSEIAQGERSASEVEAAIAALVQTSNGARGFFVTYLTSDSPLANHPSPEVFRALQTAPQWVADLLVKNLAMSTAMILTHQRHQKPDMAAGSTQVQQRTLALIAEISLPAVDVQLRQLRQSLTGEGEYQAFLNRWGYDNEQRQAIQRVLEQVLQDGANATLLRP